MSRNFVGRRGELGSLEAAWLAAGAGVAAPVIVVYGESGSAPPGVARVRLAEVLVRVLDSFERPPVVVLDDMQWAYPESLELFGHVSRLARGVLVVVSCRGSGLELGHPLAEHLAEVARERPCEYVALGSLSRGEAGELLEQAAGGPLEAALVDAVYADSGGNQFFLRELGRHLQRRGATSLAAGDGLGLPESVRGAVELRLVRQYHASATLPGAHRGAAHALTAAEAARAVGAPGDAVMILRLGIDLVSPQDTETRARVLGELARAEADAGLADDAPRTLETAISLLEQAGTPGEAIAELVYEVGVVFVFAVAPQSLQAIEPLVVRALAVGEQTRSLAWARLKLVYRIARPETFGPVLVLRAVPPDPDAVRIARSQGTEADYAFTIDASDHIVLVVLVLPIVTQRLTACRDPGQTWLRSPGGLGRWVMTRLGWSGCRR